MKEKNKSQTKMISGKNKIILNNEDAQTLIDILNDTIRNTKVSNQDYALNVQRIRDGILKGGAKK